MQPSKSTEGTLNSSIHQIESEIFQEMERKLKVERNREISDESHLNHLFKTYDEKCSENFKLQGEIQLETEQDTELSKKTSKIPSKMKASDSEASTNENQPCNQPKAIPNNKSSQRNNYHVKILKK